jgi:hypothetical protein
MAFLATNDAGRAEQQANNLRAFYRDACDYEKGWIKKLWQEAGLGEFPEPKEE